jgi:hypothetical protein
MITANALHDPLEALEQRLRESDFSGWTSIAQRWDELK